MKMWPILINKDSLSSSRDFNYQEINRGSSNLLDLKIRTILASKILKLTSSEYFELSNKSFLGTAESASCQTLLSILVILLRRVFLSSRKSEL